MFYIFKGYGNICSWIVLGLFFEQTLAIYPYRISYGPALSQEAFRLVRMIGESSA
jgi:hypothetical protein